MAMNLIRRSLLSIKHRVMKVIMNKFERNMVNTNLPLLEDLIFAKRTNE